MCVRAFLRGLEGGWRAGEDAESTWKNIRKEEINTIRMLEIHFRIEPFSRRNTRGNVQRENRPGQWRRVYEFRKGAGIELRDTSLSSTGGVMPTFKTFSSRSTLNPPTQRRTQPSPSAARSNPHSASSGGNLPRIVPLVSAKKRGARGEHSSSADAGTESKGES